MSTIKQIRVLHVIGAMNRGGAENMVMNLYRKIDREKVQFDFLVFTTEEGAFDKEILSLGGRIYSINRFDGKNVIRFKKSCDYFFDNHPEIRIVHGHIGSSAAIYLRSAKERGCFTIAHSHNAGVSPGIKGLLYNIIAFPTRYIADQLFGCSTKAGQSRYGKRCVVKPNYRNFANAIDIKKYTYDESIRKTKRNELRIPEKSFVVGAVGRITNQKNPEMIFEIFKDIIDLDKGAYCLWIGSGDQEQYFRKLVADSALDNRILMMGIRDDVHELLQVLDCYIMPSFYEGLPVTAIEAQASGLPCFLSDTITKEVEVSDLVKWESIKKPANYWAQKVIKACSFRDSRISPAEQIKNSGYDIDETARWLVEFYQHHFNENCCKQEE